MSYSETYKGLLVSLSYIGIPYIFLLTLETGALNLSSSSYYKFKLDFKTFCLLTSFILYFSVY